MLMKRFFSSCLMVLGLATAQAQNFKFPDTPSDFLPYLDKSVFPASAKNGKAKEVADLETVWNNLSETQQKQVIVLSQKMAAKRLKNYPFYSLFYQSLYHALHTENLTGEPLDKFLMASQTMLDKYDTRQLTRFWETTRSFFSQRALFASKYNTLYATGGTFEFKEIPADKPLSNNPKPDTTSAINDTIIKPVAAYEKPLQPDVYGEIMVLTGVNLVMRVGTDSLLLESTSGNLMFKDGILVGKGGKITWNLVELPEAYANLSEYNLDIRLPRLHAEMVDFHDDLLLSAPVSGIFDYEYRPHKTPKDAVFPRFISIYNNATLKDPGKNLSYIGGFSLTGRKITSNSYLRKPSFITYSSGGEIKFRLRSRQFELGDSVITSAASAVSIFQKKVSEDSILFHPSVVLKYNKNAGLLELRRPEKGYHSAPFTNTYHKVNITVDLMKWQLDSSRIDMFMTRGRDSLPALFESQDYFSEPRYASLKGIYKFHPLQLLVSYCNQLKLPMDKSPEISVDDMAVFYKLNPATVRGAMAEMANLGYIDYDPVLGRAVVYPRVTNTVASNLNQKDYDNFLIPSYTHSRPNATYDLNSNVLTIRGISAFDIRGLSDSNKRNKKKSVTIYPNRDAKSNEEREIKMLQNRYFILSENYESEVRVGENTWIGKSFIFDYEQFSLDMREIKNVIYTKVDTVVENGVKRTRKTRYGSEIKYEPGVLHIDDQNNKSGAKLAADGKSKAGYPRFDAKGGGKILFKDRLSETYGDSVYILIPDATQKNLDEAEPVFKGVFKSGGLLPDIDTVYLKYTDGKPGFEIDRPRKIYPIYEKIYNKAAKITLTGKLIMDKNGLHAPGTISYKNALIRSDNILLTPDSVVAKSTLLDLKQQTFDGIVFPAVTAKAYKVDWRAKHDSLNISNMDDPFELYKHTCLLDGTLTISAKGMAGKGGMKRKDSEVLSDPVVSYRFEQDRLIAKEAEFLIYSTNPNKPILRAQKVNLIFDVSKGVADIKTSPDEKYAGYSRMEFPYARYKTSINQAVWNVSQKQIGMKGDIKTSTFTSIDEGGQEDLNFAGNIALYRMDNQLLTIGGIPFIQTADVKIIPNNTSVTIEENAIMRELEKAQVVMDTAHEYHRFFNGNINILSRKEFTGSATLKYTNPDKQTFDIKFGNFSNTISTIKEGRKVTGEKKFTSAIGKIEVEDNFRINSRLLFYGTATVKAPEKELEMDGFIKLDLKSQPDLGRWIAYKGGDKNINIDVNDKLEGEGYKLTAGLFIDKINSGIYTTFLSEKHNPEDDEIFLANGRLLAKPETNEFVIAAPEKIAGTTLAGNTTTINDSTGIIQAAGKFNLMYGIPADYMTASGIGSMDIKAKKFSLNSLVVLNFPMHPTVVTAMGDRIARLKADENAGQKEANDDPDKLMTKLAAIIGDKAVKDYENKSAANYTPLFTLSKKLLAPMVFSNLDLKWSETSNSFYSTGTIGISNIGSVDINARFPGMVEIRKHSDGDEISVYLEISPEVWYYFDYHNKQLGAASGDEAFNTAVSKHAGKAKEGQYAVNSLEATEREAFMAHFKETYTSDNKKTVPKKQEPKKTDLPKTTEEKKPETPKNTQDKKPETVKKDDKKADKTEPKKADEKKKDPKTDKKDGF